MTPMTRRALAWSSVGLVVVAAVAWSFWPRAVAVESAVVGRGAVAVEVSDEGRTRVREVYELSAPVNGRLLRVEHHPGDIVVGGKTVLADLLPTPPAFLDVRSRAQAESAVKSAQAARTLAETEVSRANAEMLFAASDLERTRKLVEAQAIARVSLEKAELVYNVAAAQLANTQAALRARTFDLEAARALLIDPADVSAARRLRSSIPLLAPVSGRILRVLHENEAVMAAGAPILEIGDPGLLEIVVELISEDAVKVRPGMPATITDWGGGEALTARVRLVEPSGFRKVSALGVEEQRVNVLLDFTGPAEKWAPIADGFRVVAHIEIWRKEDALRLPMAAMFRNGAGWAVFAVRDGRAKLTPVMAGRSNDDFAELLGGLASGDRVILHPSDQIRDGTRVNLSASS